MSIRSGDFLTDHRSRGTYRDIKNNGIENSAIGKKEFRSQYGLCIVYSLYQINTAQYILTLAKLMFETLS